LALRVQSLLTSLTEPHEGCSLERPTECRLIKIQIRHFYCATYTYSDQWRKRRNGRNRIIEASHCSRTVFQIAKKSSLDYSESELCNNYCGSGSIIELVRIRVKCRLQIIVGVYIHPHSLGGTAVFCFIDYINTG